ncbi:MAG: T9SS type A sorting domain-containing protein [Flavobacteriales bacterium]|nr:T9SS type A sorting domain-containing protein [Flavobacteriales bacterium]MCC6656521.1 T9SS type A sorting domain-containing protein [Flavobacteriales bacterium]HMZ49259.1 T9SS type A sorting domain-containing protein [Flavobacteriales bacterium]
MYWRATIACLVLAHGLPPFGGGHALAQGFNRRYDVLGQGFQENSWAIERAGNGFLAIGTTPYITSDSLYYNPVFYTLLLDQAGAVLGSDTFFYEAHATAPGTWNCTARRMNGGYVSGGGTLSQTETGRHALWLVDPGGHVDLVTEFGGEGQFNTSRQAIECKNGDFLLVGETDSTGTIDASLVRTDSAGVVLWSRTYGGPYFDSGWSVDTTADDGFFVGGQYGYSMSGPYARQWVLRVDAQGDTLWQRIWGDGLGHQNARLTTKANGDPIVAGGTTLVEYEDHFCYLSELAAEDGAVLWERHYDNAGFDMVLHIAKEVAPGAGHIAVGNAIDNEQGHDKGVMLRTMDNGDSLWLRTFVYQDTVMSNGKGFLYDVVPTLDGGFIACGPTYGEPGSPYPPGYSQDVWVVKVDSLGCIEPGCNIPMGITTQITNLKGALSLAPNPAHGQCTVQVDLPLALRSEQLRLVVVSAQGQLVREVKVVQGRNTVDLSTLVPGLYHMHLANRDTWLAGAKLIME